MQKVDDRITTPKALSLRLYSSSLAFLPTVSDLNSKAPLGHSILSTSCCGLLESLLFKIKGKTFRFDGSLVSV